MNTPAGRATARIRLLFFDEPGCEPTYMDLARRSKAIAAIIQQVVNEATEDLRAEVERMKADAARLLVGQIDAAVGDLWTKEGEEEFKNEMAGRPEPNE